MKINVAFLPADVNGRDLSDTVCVILDVFRASSSIVTALSNGCEAILPVLTIEEGQRLAREQGPCLLAGERHSLKIEGFDLGNSPYDFAAEIVKGRRIIMTTTNGTVAIRSTKGAYRTYIGSFLNATAVCQEILKWGKDVLFVCAGTERLFSLEDALCAGFMVEILQSQNPNASLTDAAYAAQLMYTQAKGALVEVTRNSRNGNRLYELGKAEDVIYCLQADLLDIVPVYSQGMITVNTNCCGGI